jgi:hypothetical protein
VGLGILAHLLDLFLGQAAGGGDGDLLLLARAEVLGAHVQDAVGIDVEGHLDLRHAARRGRDVREMELARWSCCPSPSCARPAARGFPRVGWLSLAVLKISLDLVGIVVLRSING